MGDRPPQKPMLPGNSTGTLPRPDRSQVLAVCRRREGQQVEFLRRLPPWALPQHWQGATAMRPGSHQHWRQSWPMPRTIDAAGKSQAGLTESWLGRQAAGRCRGYRASFAEPTAGRASVPDSRFRQYRLVPSVSLHYASSSTADDRLFQQMHRDFRHGLSATRASPTSLGNVDPVARYDSARFLNISVQY